MQSKRIAILVETALDSGRQIVRGIARFASERNDWSLFYHTGPLGAMVPASLESWDGDGIIARIANNELLDVVRRHQVPVVDVMGNVPEADYPVVKCDDHAISELVINHFTERGYQHIAFFGLKNEIWSRYRKSALETACQERLGSRLHTLEVGHTDRDASGWPSYFKKLASWVESLPKPIGIMVASDQFGPDLLVACRQAGFTIPDQVSVVGVDNDVPFCEISQPHLSSVEPNHERIGYEAAKMLQKTMEGSPPVQRTVEIPPILLHVRPSSDATALADPVLVKALRYIRQNACLSIGVDEIAKEAGVSRSVLQRRFRKVLDRTVLEAILSVRMKRAQEMLTVTDLPLPDVAERTGFKHQEYLGYVFKKRIGCTPGQFRARAKGKSS
ncbi:XylR family transcriptional regulator [Pelagicoccus sp. SDUM812003]|uniref:AraC family transcriptional regulator n=1 Tax=Pelagicoccus sp. SDUM812003 TaxID=3041267 RepID=UPI00280D016B|nr:XylR family transcriptional regulator [Pelagicoccus sp. SDUM812003]MDQ8202032.1 XylR family transcriptional regulator [Pelagicoccus sp. SDUM812003]